MARQHEAIVAAEKDGRNERAAVLARIRDSTPSPSADSSRRRANDDDDFDQSPAPTRPTPMSYVVMIDDVNIITNTIRQDYECLNSESDESNSEPWVDDAEIMVDFERGEDDFEIADDGAVDSAVSPYAGWPVLAPDEMLKLSQDAKCVKIMATDDWEQGADNMWMHTSCLMRMLSNATCHLQHVLRLT